MSDQRILQRLAPVLRPFAEARTDLSMPVLAVVRDGLNQRRAASAHEVDAVGVEIDERELGGVRVRIYRGAPAPAPAVAYCHAGAFVLGNLDTDHLQCVQFARQGRCTVISVDYRLAPEHPYPAALDDAIAVLRAAVDGAVELGIDPARVAVAGSSAGAALAARLAHCAADGLVPPVAFQLLHQPVLDDRPTPSKQAFDATPGFDGRAAELMWRHYLAGRPASADQVPARRTELSGVAPALITCSELDPLRDEAIDYARRLLHAGVATELHVFPGTCHGFDSLLPDWEVSRELFDIQGAALRRALHG
ncbi:MAG: alpha/beta hydrolase [Mycolicibacterium hassiacum]|jgi:acetyl esterase/lipase|uniref:alpha/beta hydrolase n=1 Tax=Mycolicibacterium hassiacum TaxID=46351 RepID=UPI0023FA49C8|nr:alpha/beta hydrolase [Mycolicibacterium hassiacum]MBX5488204.1 alpha/beta hydrolase [Mycolicibacterium hassiacum]